MQHKIFMVKAYYRTGIIINGEWRYSIQECFNDFTDHFGIVEYIRFYDALRHTVELFDETGGVTRRKGSGRPTKRTPDVLENVRQIMAEAPSTSLRRLSQRIDLPYTTTRNILKADLKLFPYKVTSVHQILPADMPLRERYCQWFLNAFPEDNDLNNVFFSDEAWFHLSGYVNSQNMRIWSAENPYAFRETPLHPQKLGVWIGLSRRRLVGPIFFQGTINALRYREEILEPFINQLDDQELREGYFQQDGSPVHCTLENLNFIQEFFGNRVISRNTPVAYPPRSCDLTTLDFFVWPYVKNSIYQTPIQNLDELAARIIHKCNEINNSQHMLENVSRSLQKRARLCIEQGGGHFEHLL